MRNFDYCSLRFKLWDNSILNYLSQIHELRGVQNSYLQKNLAVVEKLLETAKVQSVEASNRIEGIVTTTTRARQLVLQKTFPRNRNEKEIAGYRDVLNTIHESYEYIPIKSSVILQLHRDLMRYAETGLGGKYKAAQNYIQEKVTDEETYIRFTPVSPIETAPCIEAICESYRIAADSLEVSPLLVIPVFILDFLCIHPFHDGNGRMSRLLTVLMLYKAGYSIERYVSIEKHIEKTKDVYYNALLEASNGWHEGTNDPTPFIKYMLGIFLACYRELDGYVNRFFGDKVVIKKKAYDIIKATVDCRIGKFTKAELISLCPGIGVKSIENILKKLTDEGHIVKGGSGRSTFYVRE